MHKKSLTAKIMALLLTVVLVVALFPATLFAQAEPIDMKPFYLVNWDRGFTTGTYSNVYAMPYTWTKIYAEGTDASKTDWYYPGEDGSLGYINIGLYFNGKSTSNIKTAAQWLKEEFDKMPEGSRYINLAAMGTVFNAFVKDAIDFEDGITLMADWLDRFLTEYKSIGGKLDGIATDLEYNYYTSFYLESRFCNALKVVKNAETGVYEMVEGPRNLDILQDIVRNERVYQAKIRPQLKELEAQGKFQFYTTGINPETGLPDDLSTAKGPNTISSGGTRLPIPVSEISTINRYAESGGISSCSSMWGAVLLRHLIDSINRAAYYPMLEHYPEANLSDYSHANTYSWHKGFATDGGGTGTGVMAGNTTNKVYYGSQFSEYYYATYSGSATQQTYFKPAGMYGALYEATDPYYRAIMDINNQKNAFISTKEFDEDAKVSVWVPYYNYSSNTRSYGDTPYFTEVMYHFGLTDPEPYLGYIIKSEVESKGKGEAFAHDPNYASFPFALQVTNEILAELTRVAGAADRKPIETPVTWDDGFVYSGMYAGGRNIWRITPDNNKISVEDFKVSGTKAPTFSVNGVTITFPQGRIIEDTDITHVGSYGYWVETPADVTPVITKNANYFEENPAFGEDFSKYLEGAFTGSAASVDKTLFAGGYRPDTYWIASGSAAIVSNNGDKALTMTGTTTLKNSASQADKKASATIPALITAGDYYAKQQAWEVTVTMPSKFSGTTSLLSTLSSYSGKDGFQITSSGVVRYPYIYSAGGTSGSFTNLGLTLTAGQTYTFKRVINFNTNKCDYYVYDANGKLLKSQTNKNLYKVTTPVSTIYMHTSSVTGTVTVDDYKLYPVGLTATLDLYDVDALSYFSNYNGLVSKISDTSAARTEKTTYRVSWLNNSGSYQYAVLKNKTTGEVIEKVLMAPGDHGYFTGIVDASASAPVTFVLSTESATAPTTPDYENGNFDWPGYAENLGIVCYVGDQGYPTLEEALAAATNGQTIVMISDAKMASTAVVDSSVNIRHNGHTISLANNFSGDAAITLVAGGKLTWEDGLSIDAGNKTAFCVAGGDLTVTGGTITAQNGILVAGGKLTVTGGTVTATGNAIQLTQDADKTAATVTVTGGKLIGENAFLHTNATETASKDLTVTISGATLTGAVKTTEEHFAIKTEGDAQILHGHTVVIDAAAAPTCTETGLTQGYHYPCCNEVGLAQEIVPAAGHKWVDATYCGASKSCSVCNITDGDPMDHNYQAPVVTPPTCTENGKTTETCSICGHEKIYDITPATHKPGEVKIENVVPVTCTTDGTCDEVRYCTVCTLETSRNKVTTDIATGHTPGQAQVENKVDETCTTDGSYDSVTYCTVCSTETSRQNVPVAATGHTPGDIVVENQVAMTCTEDGSYDNVRYCTICLAVASRETIIIPAPVGGHNEDGFLKNVISVGTCTTEDSYENIIYCTACGYEHSRVNVTTPAPGHKYVVGKTNVTCENCDYDEVIGTSSLVVTTGNNSAKTQWKPTLSIGMAPAYAKTTAEGALIKEGTESDYNLKVEWPVGGKPTLTLNGATLTNDTNNAGSSTAMSHTIDLGGSADFAIVLKGTNTINGATGVNDTTMANHRGPAGIRGDNTGKLTITSLNKTEDTLFIDTNGGNGIYKSYNAMTIQSANIKINMRNTASNGQVAIVMAYTSAGYEDKTNLTVKDSILTITNTGRYLGNSFVYMGKTGTYTSANTGDILFQNSVINMNRNNGSSANSAGAETIKFSPNGSMTIDRCDFDIGGNHRTFNHAPAVINCTNVQFRTGWSNWGEYTFEPGTALSSNNAGLKGTHVCMLPETTVEIINNGSCNTIEETVSYCVVCNERTVLDSTNTSTKVHTPGEKELLKQTNATLASSSSKPYVAGTYLWKYTCSVCGETWEETEDFAPGVLFYIKPASDYHTSSGTKYLTTPYYQYGSSWNNNYYTPAHTIQPGTTLYFLTQAGVNENIPGNSYLIQTTDADVIANGTWNVKVEYPVGGTPVMTLNNATIINGAGIWWGYAVHQNVAPLKIVVKGENYIGQTRYTNGGVLNFRTTADVTITGSGTLNLVSNGNGAAIRSSKGNIIFDNANINLQNYSASSTHHSIEAETGSITINGGNFTMTGNRNNASEALSGIRTGGDITIKGGANVSLTNAVSSNSYALLHATGDVTISESYVKLASVYRGYAIMCGGTLTLDYTNGFTAKSIQKLTTLADGVYTYPDLSTATVDTTVSGVMSHMARYYMEITPDKALTNFTGTAVTIKDDLDVSFRLDTDKVDQAGTVTFTVNGEEITKPLSEYGKAEGADYVITLPGLSAKQMRDEITVTVYDSEGKAVTETKSDSVQAYALRLLNNENYAADTETNNALKTFLVDMLIYGSMAQIQFDVEGDLPTAALTEKDWTYASTELREEVTKTPAAASTAGYLGTTFELKSNIGMAVALDARVLPDVAYAKVTFTDYLGYAKEFFVYEKDVTSTARYTIYVFNELAAANGRQDITWTFYNAENEVQLTVTDSLANYVGRARENYPYMDELMKYCDSAKAYFELLYKQ